MPTESWLAVSHSLILSVYSGVSLSVFQLPTRSPLRFSFSISALVRIIYHYLTFICQYQYRYAKPAPQLHSPRLFTPLPPSPPRSSIPQSSTLRTKAESEAAGVTSR
ncbi:hypothetical protein BDV18DRAFT_134845 [Aspergillus unguis]